MAKAQAVRINTTYALKLPEELAKRVAREWERVEERAQCKVTINDLLRALITDGLSSRETSNR